MAVLHRLDRELAADPNLSAPGRAPHGQLRPRSRHPRATRRAARASPPEVRLAIRHHLGASQLQPLLADFDQWVAKLHFPDGRWSGLFRHVLKVFLLDEENRVRNIYSVGFLDADLVLTDLRTLLVASKG